MHTQEQIFSKISEMIEKLFEIPQSDIKMESRLYEDLDLDSIDAVDLMVQLQTYVGTRIQPDDFKNVRTVGDVVVAAEKLFDEDGPQA